MKVYIAGAITSNPRYKERFEEAEKRLISMGHAVINPVKNLGFEYREYTDRAVPYPILHSYLRVVDTK